MRQRRKLVHAALAIALVLGTAEVALRLARFGPRGKALGAWTVAPPWERLRGFTPEGDPDPLPRADVAWSLAPGEPVIRYRLNALGLREDREIAPWPAAGTCRILAIGDAYTFGYGVPVAEAWPQQLERRLAHSGRVEVVNAGFPNLNVEQQRRRLAQLLPRLHPDAVVATFDWWNVPLADEASPRPSRWSRAWWIANAEEKASRAGGRIALVDEGLRLARHASGLFPPSGLARELEPLSAPPGTLAERWKRTRSALAGMAADAADAHAAFALVVTPLDLQVDPARNALYRDGDLPYPSHGFADLDYRAARAMPEALHRFALEAGIALVDTTPEFTVRGAERLFLARDYHAGPAGHAVIARAVRRWSASGCSAVARPDVVRGVGQSDGLARAVAVSAE